MRLKELLDDSHEFLFLSKFLACFDFAKLFDFSFKVFCISSNRNYRRDSVGFQCDNPISMFKLIALMPQKAENQNNPILIGPTLTQTTFAQSDEETTTGQSNEEAHCQGKEGTRKRSLYTKDSYQKYLRVVHNTHTKPMPTNYPNYDCDTRLILN